MHDTYLLNKISQSLNEICEKNYIKRIDKFTLVVSFQNDIDEVNLQKYLEVNSKDIFGDELEIKIERDDIEDQTAIIHSIQGETLL
ncbi:hypothetical protein K8M07_05190 [Schnuerera sp. xch1]|uniref:hypothetical protein n=1 Tax=Schnuerera sp. xch1 TaxID=2874283 RepID=UPI001CBDBD73|nr:hypothetical protein [Schnuerera sp. xch1]MBZ2174639.1 hypothetical protein [Schnuerera sp. xch1]